MTVKEAKIDFIINATTELFMKKSIEEVTIKDVAEEVGLGEATIYRYFARKQNLVSACALKLQKRVYEEYFDLSAAKNGAQKISAFYGAYYKVFSEKPEFYGFLSQFDAYCVAENVKTPEEYSEGVDLFKELFLSALKQGEEDKTLRKIDDPETFYYATAHSLLGLCKKLSSDAKIVKQDGVTDKKTEVNRLIEVFLKYLVV